MGGDIIDASIRVGIYRHYKGQLYRVLGIANHSETLELLVVYQALYDSQDFGANVFWVRPLDMFLETVMVDGKEKPRFEWIPEVSIASSFHH